MEKIYITTMNREYFDSLGFKTLQSWLKNCKHGKIILYAENFVPNWLDTQAHQIINWDDSYYDRLIVKELSLSDQWANLHNLLTGRAKNFVWKAAAWSSAVREFKGVVTFFDADLLCFNDPSLIIDQFITNDYDASILSVKDIRPHADTCFYSINTTKTNDILKEYEHQYTKEIFNKSLYPKPYDAPVWSRTLDILKNEIKIWNFNNNSDAKSPLKDTILTSYFRHLKANQKDSGRLLGLIDKTMNAIDKNKSIDDILLRFDRKLRQDDSKKTGVPY